MQALVLLIGDAGDALPGADPVLAAAARDVERWAPRLGRGEVIAAFLGDMVYPEGVRPPEDPGHARDTLALHAQLRVISGPAGRAAAAEAWFVPGNHDRGDRPGEAGRSRLRRTADRIELWRRAGHLVRMWPEQDTTPAARQPVGSDHWLVGLDTQAWLEADDGGRSRLQEGYRRALVEAGDRTVTVLAHHPLRSAGEHGAEPPAGQFLELAAAVSRAGAMIQDVSAPRYRRFIEGVAAAGREAAPPRVWASGHDHTLQLLRGGSEGLPHWLVVSGSASKVGPVAASPHLVAGGGWPGYARLFLLDGGEIHLEVVAAPRAHASCADAADRGACMASAAAAFRTVVSRRLPGP